MSVRTRNFEFEHHTHPFSAEASLLSLPQLRKPHSRDPRPISFPLYPPRSSRWGKAAHITFLCFCFLTNIIVTAMLLLGGSAVVNALTGLDIYLASFLIPLGVIVYTLAGGLKVRSRLGQSISARSFIL